MNTIDPPASSAPPSDATRRGSRPRLREIRVELEVPFHDVDAMRLVWHGHYSKYLEIARTQLFRSCGLDLGDVVGARYAFVMIEFRCRHVSPLRYRDVAEVRAWFRDVKYRLCVEYEIRNRTTRARVARAHTMLATTDLEGGLRVRTPPEILERILPPAEVRA